MLKQVKNTIKQSPLLNKAVRTVQLPFTVGSRKSRIFAADQDQVPRQVLMSEVKKMKAPAVLEMGTRVQEQGSTHRKKWFNGISDVQYTLTDYTEGRDVDVVSDAHFLSRDIGLESQDVIMCMSVFEHLKYPFVASHEILKTLKVGGVAYIKTHQTYHLHGYPSDYFRFSRQAMKALFPPEMGCEVLVDFFEGDCDIFSYRTGVMPNESYLNVGIIVKKVAKTPDSFIYDFSHDKN